ncbi:putative membrane protein YfcA [Okibacterium sp. HSC-33S16]|uniref:sulfite exporter TauE/SafE family protein n=1 Tax=Okibacterium sp. HSC-33S16 TaxID=2910965 RepID=UPI0020A020CC|nr:sulfite exporter TauE/SafE family protein [Okibacterium sp. HSC-33S16]MCP2032343.1 putative membrane protein YfcA [Okibacterium sp. HSC-33S16]
MPQPPTRGHWAWLVVIGLAAGFLSGLFGVGGGILIVPALVILLALDQRIAAGTSLAAIVPMATVGVLSYALGGSVDWIVALLLVIGSVVGAQIGSALLARIPRRVLSWFFIGFLVVVIGTLFLAIPSRDASVDITVLSGAGLVVLGLGTGVLSGLLGIGGGVVIVPLLILLFGASDLVAKGTSLLVIIPTALFGTLGNLRRHNVDLSAAAVIGVSACTTTAAGAAIAGIISPTLSTVLFAIFLAAVAVQMTVKVLRSR